MGKAILWANSGEISIPESVITLIIIFATTGSPIQPNPRLARVIPSWVAARYPSSFETRFLATPAR